VNKVGVDPPRAAGIGVEGSVSRLARIKCLRGTGFIREERGREGRTKYVVMLVETPFTIQASESRSGMVDGNRIYSVYLMPIRLLKRRPMLRCSDAPMLSV
jgi:hypothetical protein